MRPSALPELATVLLLNTTFKQEGPTNTLLGIARGVRDRFRIVAGCLAAGGPVRRIFEDMGVTTHNTDMAFPLDPRGVLRLARFLRGERVDLLHTQLLRGEVVGTLAAKRVPGVKVVAVVQNTDPYRDPHDSLVRARLSRWALGRADVVVAVSHGVADFVHQVQGVPRDRIRVIPNGADPSPRAQGQAGRFVVGTAGRLDEQKGVDVLLEAMVRVVSEVPRARLRVAGSGPHEAELRQTAAHLGLGNTVEFAGFLPEMQTFWSSLDVFVLPSRWEGMPFALLEAMARGLPVVATNVPGSSEAVIDGREGVIVPSDDAAALAAGIVRLLTHRDLAARMGLAGRRRVASCYTERSMAEAYAALYESLLAGVRPINSHEQGMNA